MFDIGFSELVVIGLVALIVIGPERLPRVARTAGALLGRFQRYVNDVKSEVRREMEIEDLKKFQSQLTDQVREVENTIHSELRSAEDVARSAVAEVTGTPRIEAAESAAHAELRAAEDVARSVVAEVTGTPRVEAPESAAAGAADEASRQAPAPAHKDDNKTT